MKKSFVLGAAVVLLLSLAGCAGIPGSSGSSGRGLNGVSVPDFVNEAYRTASEDALIGVGMYTIGNDITKMSTGKTFAETRARADLTRQLSVMVKDMVTDYTGTSEIEAAKVSFQENVTQTLASTTLTGARTKVLQADNGILYVVMELGKSAATDIVNQAVNAAKLAVPAMIAFDGVERMEAKFAKEAGGGPIPVGD
jgi:hypothetical protein